MHPANLPDVLDAQPDYGPLRTLFFFVLYGALVAGILIYMLRKLPRDGGGRGDDGAGGEDGRSDAPGDGDDDGAGNSSDGDRTER